MLDVATQCCQLLSEPTRVRILMLLAEEELSVAEVVEATGIGQSGVSGHLRKLREAGLVRGRKEGAWVFYRLDRTGMPQFALGMWRQVEAEAGRDERVLADRRRRQERRGGSWADSVAGRMSRRYSPGRTWQTLARATVRLTELGDVIDIASGDGAVTELLAPMARTVLCVDRSERVVELGKDRMKDLASVAFSRGDMHDLPVIDGGFDLALLMNALCHSDRPELALAEAARALRPGGRLVGATLARHDHLDQTARFDHVRPGFDPDELAGLLCAAGLNPNLCAVTSQERRAPHFEGLTFDATQEGA
jgi:ArsR family transcriptional regulator